MSYGNAPFFPAALEDGEGPGSCLWKTEKGRADIEQEIEEALRSDEGGAICNLTQKVPTAEALRGKDAKAWQDALQKEVRAVLGTRRF
jgi:hypothetical protein